MNTSLNIIRWVNKWIKFSERNWTSRQTAFKDFVWSIWKMFVNLKTKPWFCLPSTYIYLTAIIKLEYCFSDFNVAQSHFLPYSLWNEYTRLQFADWFNLFLPKRNWWFGLKNKPMIFRAGSLGTRQITGSIFSILCIENFVFLKEKVYLVIVVV